MNAPAFIFDFDGVLVDTMEAHFKCYEAASAEVGVPMDKAQFYRQAGMSGIEQIEYFAEKAGKDIDARAVYMRKKELYKDFADLADLIEPNYVLITSLHAAGHKIAIASGGSRGSILPLVDKYNIPYNVLVTTEDVAKGKPNPDLFLEAARQLGVAPECCVVIEDSDAGMEAARRAGMSALRFCEKLSVGSQESWAQS